MPTHEGVSGDTSADLREWPWIKKDSHGASAASGACRCSRMPTAKSAAIQAEAVKMQTDVNEKQKKYVEAADGADWVADGTVRRIDEQKTLKVADAKLNITGGLLYRYNQKAADEIKKLRSAVNAKRMQKPIGQFPDIANEVPGQIALTKVFCDIAATTRVTRITFCSNLLHELPHRHLAWSRHGAHRG
jgi:hypothetical protein